MIEGWNFENVVLKPKIDFCNFFEKTHFTTQWLGRLVGGEIVKGGGKAKRFLILFKFVSPPVRKIA